MGELIQFPKGGERARRRGLREFQRSTEEGRLIHGMDDFVTAYGTHTSVGPAAGGYVGRGYVDEMGGLPAPSWGIVSGCSPEMHMIWNGHLTCQCGKVKADIR